MSKYQSVIVVANNKLPLAQAIAAEFGIEILPLEMGKFADTERYVQFHDVLQVDLIHSHLKEKLVILVGQFFHFSRDSINDQLIQLLLLAHQAKLHGAHRIVALLPYLPYARQCKDVKSEHTGPLEAIGNLCKSVGIDHVVSCEIHEEACRSMLSLPLHQISCEAVWYDLLRKEFSPEECANLCFVSPDAGGVERAKRVAQLFDAPWAFVTKRRVELDKSVAIDLQGEADAVKDKIVVLIDDIIDTGITAIEASEKILAHGAKRVFACFVHPVLSLGSVERLEASKIEKIWTCDTILLDGVDLGEKITVVSVQQLITDYLHEVIKKK